MALWKNLVVALVAAFMLVACSSSSNDPAPTDNGGSTTTEPIPTEQIAMLEEQINALRAELGFDPIDIDDLTASVSDLQGQVASLTQQIANRDKAAADAEADRIAKEMAEAGKALKGAVDPNPLGYAVTVTSLTGAGVMATMNHDRDDGTTALVNSPRLAPDDSGGSLGGWDGQWYSRKNPGTGVSNQALIYSNPAAATVNPFATGATQADADGGTSAPVAVAPTAAWEYQASTRTLQLPADPTAAADIAGDMFPTSGMTTYTPGAVSNNVVITGTYQGAPGNYRCSGASCTAAAAADGAIDLGGQWYFSPQYWSHDFQTRR
ncbi:MAG: hypothetical protein OXF33_14540 [Rhodospirillales bacterium]|nr:hypothetical protein [Rhodospirillales bacterium]